MSRSKKGRPDGRTAGWTPWDHAFGSPFTSTSTKLLPRPLTSPRVGRVCSCRDGRFVAVSKCLFCFFDVFLSFFVFFCSFATPKLLQQEGDMNRLYDQRSAIPSPFPLPPRPSSLSPRPLLLLSPPTSVSVAADPRTSGSGRSTTVRSWMSSPPFPSFPPFPPPFPILPSPNPRMYAPRLPPHSQQPAGKLIEETVRPRIQTPPPLHDTKLEPKYVLCLRL